MDFLVFFASPVKLNVFCLRIKGALARRLDLSHRRREEKRPIRGDAAHHRNGRRSVDKGNVFYSGVGKEMTDSIVAGLIRSGGSKHKAREIKVSTVS